MLKASEDNLKAAGYRPYYFYGQKHDGTMENLTGYIRAVRHVYTIYRIMDENQSILALD